MERPSTLSERLRELEHEAARLKADLVAQTEARERAEKAARDAWRWARTMYSAGAARRMRLPHS